MCVSNEPEDQEPKRFQGRACSRRAFVRYVQVSSGRNSARVHPGAMYVF